jgi:hypothetical protein
MKTKTTPLGGMPTYASGVGLYEVVGSLAEGSS